VVRVRVEWLRNLSSLYGWNKRFAFSISSRVALKEFQPPGFFPGVKTVVA
jgi:hypothetical protein